MAVGRCVFRKGAREEAAKALVGAVLSRGADYSAQARHPYCQSPTVAGQKVLKADRTTIVVMKGR
jgi:hypothetical protein